MKKLYNGNQGLIPKRSIDDTDKGCITEIERRNSDVYVGEPQCYTTRLLEHQKNAVNRVLGISSIQPLSVSTKCGRISSPLTSMPKDARNKLVDSEGNKLITIDFKTSHLQHLILVLEKSNEIDPDELKRFKIAVQGQDFYSSLNYGNCSRDKMKKYVMCWLTTSHQNWKGVKHIKGLYPSISDFIEKINGNTHNVLVNELMRSESNLINYTVLQTIAENDKDILAFSVYDAIVIEPRYLNYSLEIINEKGTEYFGFKPRYTIERNNEPVLVKETVLVPNKKLIMKTEHTEKKKKAILQSLVDVYGRNSEKAVSYAYQNRLEIPSCKNGAENIPYAGKGKYPSALNHVVESWPDIDEALVKIGEVKF